MGYILNVRRAFFPSPSRRVLAARAIFGYLVTNVRRPRMFRQLPCFRASILPNERYLAERYAPAAGNFTLCACASYTTLYIKLTGQLGLFSVRNTRCGVWACWLNYVRLTANAWYLNPACVSSVNMDRLQSVRSVKHMRTERLRWFPIKRAFHSFRSNIP